MAFGPEILVQRIHRVDGSKAAAINLAPFEPTDAAAHFPFSGRDVALNFLSPETSASLLESTPDRFFELRIRGPNRLAWGIWNEKMFAGCIDFYHGLDASPGLNIVLTPGSRGLGIGTMATAAATKAVFTPGLTANHVPEYCKPIVTEIDTMIHPDNTPSKVMCESLGFRQLGPLARITRYSQKRWIHYGALNPDLANAAAVGSPAQSGVERRKRTMEQFIIKT